MDGILLFRSHPGKERDMLCASCLGPARRAPVLLPVITMQRPHEASGAGLRDLLRLHLATLYHPQAGRQILEAFGTIDRVFRAGRSALRALPGVPAAVALKLLEPETGRRADEELRRATNEGVSLLAWGTDEYPSQLAPLQGMPLVLYCRGRIEPEGALAPALVAVVGSRRPTPYGLAQARRFARGLVERGITVVSGLAAGIDGEAHRTALDAGGRTVAVLGSGLGRIYPGEHRSLAQRIAAEGRGAILSELPFDAAPKSFHFPMRNRILSGLSAAVLVVEAGERSGSLITVGHALDQGRSVYAVPGRVDRPEALGCLRLIVDGATPVIGPEDVLPGVGRAPAPGGVAAGGSGALPARAIDGPFGAGLEKLFAEEDAWHPDGIAERLGAPASALLQELGRLEAEGLVRRMAGGVYVKA